MAAGYNFATFAFKHAATLMILYKNANTQEIITLFEYWRDISASREQTVAMRVCVPVVFDLAISNMRGCSL